MNIEEQAAISQRIGQWVETHRDEAIELLKRLVQTTSVNNPPTGDEAACQQVIADWLTDAGATAETYALADVPGLQEHPAYMSGRDYNNRPNVIGTFAGSGGGRSLLFSSHIDTVYEGTETWTHGPFAAEVVDGRLYGRGSYDMKGGLAASMIAAKALRELGIRLRGDIRIESVVDEEHGGANGTLAGRLRGDNADMAVIPEPSNLRMYPAHLGGGIWRASFTGRSGIAFNGEKLVSALEATVDFARLVREFGEFRKRRDTPPAWWRNGSKPAEVAIMSISSGDHARELQEKVPATGELSFWIEGYPGQTGDELLADLMAYYETRLDDYPALRSCRPTLVPLIRYLSASEMPADEKTAEFLRIARAAGTRAIGREPLPDVGAPFACDGFMFHLYSATPALILGPEGANAHAPDEYIDLDSYLKLIRWYAEMAVDWCGVQSD
ncbi:MAG: M20/M25/M40 family metallo-hydrolase [Paenibacillaceae bacterium]|nr:M20/M25/M40 family metallo-hydrolase [Paenibacillaceae bacterium]